MAGKSKEGTKKKKGAKRTVLKERTKSALKKRAAKTGEEHLSPELDPEVLPSETEEALDPAAAIDEELHELPMDEEELASSFPELELPETEESQETALAPAGPAPALQRFSPLQQYLAEVRKYPLLSKEEEFELAVRYREHGDLNAARTLVASNLRLVVKIALEYYRHWMDLLDLIQEGNLGLLQAVKKFDPYRGIRLSTYASFWIRAYILKFLMDNWRLVKIGTTQAQRKLFFNLKKEKERLEKFGFKPGPKMLAESLSVSENEVLEMDQRLSSWDESLDTPVSEDGKQSREMLIPDEQPPVDEVIADDEFARLVRKKLENFRRKLDQEGKEKEAFIFDHRLTAENPLTLQEVGEKFGISRERVRQLEARLIKELQEFFKQELPDYENYEFALK